MAPPYPGFLEADVAAAVASLLANTELTMVVFDEALMAPPRPSKVIVPVPPSESLPSCAVFLTNVLVNIFNSPFVYIAPPSPPLLSINLQLCISSGMLR